MLLINGSIRKHMTSYQFAKAFESASHEKSEIIWVHDYLEATSTLIKLIEAHDSIGIITPLYVDTLPAAVIEMMENLSQYKGLLKGKKLFSLAQSGFPDDSRMIPLSLTCQSFAEDMDMQWLGAIMHGGGVIIDGRPIDKLGKKGQRLMTGINYAMDAIERGEGIPDLAQDYVKSRMPRSVFPLLAWFLNSSAKKEAKKNGVDLFDPYYLQE